MRSQLLPPGNRPLMLRKEGPVLIRPGEVSGKVFPEKVRSDRLAENIELAVADQPVLRVGLDEFALAQRHGAEVSKLRRVAQGVSLKELAMLGAREAVAKPVPLIFDLRYPARRFSVGEIRDRVVALDRERNPLGNCRRYRGRPRAGCD